MDERCTLPVDGDFIGLINNLINDGAHADLIIDTNGLERASGKIVELTTDSPKPAIILDNGQHIEISTIIAINGLFKSDYTCC
ncbi:MAG: hypothetical protein ACK5NK_13415 [Niabella sp.]